MFSRLALLSLALVAPALADDVTANQFILGDNAFLMYGRNDPIISPGKVGQHVHQFIGASNIRDVLNTPAEQRNAVCSSTKVSVDKSSYWTPTLYYMWSNGTYSPLTSNTRVYYTVDKSENGVTPSPFPEGLRMVSGLATFRDEGAEQTVGVRITYNREKSENDRFMARKRATPPNQVIASISFPRCGRADQALDSDDHFSHMAHPVYGQLNEWAVNSRKCPDTHPIWYPQILVETLFDLTDAMKADWNPNDSNFIISNGDVTGVTWHGDFVNGWDSQVLADTINQCGGVGDNLDACAPLKPHLQGDDRYNCRIQGQILNEDMGFLRPLPALPGCNPKWDWDGPTSKPNACPAGHRDPGWVDPQFALISFYSQAFPLAAPGYTGNLSDVHLPDYETASRGYDVRTTEWGRTINHHSHTSANTEAIEYVRPSSSQQEIDSNNGGAHPIVNKLGDGSAFSGTSSSPRLSLISDQGASDGGHYERENMCWTRPKLDWNPVPCGEYKRTGGPAKRAHARDFCA